MKAQITTRALIQRINRALAKENEVLKTSRTAKMIDSVGDYYTVKINGSCISRVRVDLEKLGRDLGIFKPYEKVE